MQWRHKYSQKMQCIPKLSQSVSFCDSKEPHSSFSLFWHPQSQRPLKSSQLQSGTDPINLFCVHRFSCHLNSHWFSLSEHSFLLFRPPVDMKVHAVREEPMAQLWPPWWVLNAAVGNKIEALTQFRSGETHFPGRSSVSLINCSIGASWPFMAWYIYIDNVQK